MSTSRRLSAAWINQVERWFAELTRKHPSGSPRPTSVRSSTCITKTQSPSNGPSPLTRSWLRPHFRSYPFSSGSSDSPEGRSSAFLDKRTASLQGRRNHYSGYRVASRAAAALNDSPALGVASAPSSSSVSKKASGTKGLRTSFSFGSIL